MTEKPVVARRLHHLRRAFASNLAALGVALPVVEQLLNHVSHSFAGIVAVYQRYEFQPAVRVCWRNSAPNSKAG
jgi:site-specific recombinase XerD